MPTTIPLSEYAPELRAAQVFKLEALPKSSPTDINLSVLMEESGWNLADRFRFWHHLGGISGHAGLTVRKLDVDEQALVHCNMDIEGRLQILSNNQRSAIRFFRMLFLNGPPTFYGERNWKVTRGWTGDRSTVAFFAGSVAGARGWGPKVPHEIESSL